MDLLSIAVLIFYNISAALYKGHFYSSAYMISILGKSYMLYLDGQSSYERDFEALNFIVSSTSDFVFLYGSTVYVLSSLYSIKPF